MANPHFYWETFEFDSNTPFFSVASHDSYFFGDCFFFHSEFGFYEIRMNNITKYKQGEINIKTNAFFIDIDIICGVFFLCLAFWYSFGSDDSFFFDVLT